MEGKTAPQIVTVQIGRGAGFVGAHFWSLAEEELKYEPEDQSLAELAPSSLFERYGDRARANRARTVCFDKLASSGSLANAEVLSEEERSAYWDGTINVIETETSSGEYEEQWGRLMQMDIAEEAIWTPAVVRQGDNFDGGKELFKELGEEWADVIRRQVELCDYFRLFNWIVDAGGLSGGFALEAFDYVVDEIGPVDHMLTSVSEEQHFLQEDRPAQEISRALFLANTMDRVTGMLPISLNSMALHHDERSPFRRLRSLEDTSAVAAMMLDTIIGPWRRAHVGFESVRSLDASMREHKVFDAFFALPLYKKEGGLLHDFSPIGVAPRFAQVFSQTFRGLAENLWSKQPVVLSPYDPIHGQDYRPYVKGDLAALIERSQDYLQMEEPHGLNLAGKIEVVARPVCLHDTFPNILKSNVTCEGRYSENERDGRVFIAPTRVALGISDRSQKFLDDCVSTLRSSLRMSSLSKGSDEEAMEIQEHIENLQIRSSYLETALKYAQQQQARK